MNKIEEHLRKPGVMASLTAGLMADKALRLITEERGRQQTQEGYTPAHDDELTSGMMAVLAAAYALSSREHKPGGIESYDPFVAPPNLPTKELEFIVEMLDSYGWAFNPQSPVRDLVRAGALILAEIERRLRAEEGIL